MIAAQSLEAVWLTIRCGLWCFWWWRWSSAAGKLAKDGVAGVRVSRESRRASDSDITTLRG
jgi:hypothetical protein